MCTGLCPRRVCVVECHAYGPPVPPPNDIHTPGLCTGRRELSFFQPAPSLPQALNSSTPQHSYMFRGTGVDVRSHVIRIVPRLADLRQRRYLRRYLPSFVRSLRAPPPCGTTDPHVPKRGASEDGGSERLHINFRSRPHNRSFCSESNGVFDAVLMP